MQTNKFKILIVEDEENINNLLQTLLQTNGYQVISATSCKNAIMLFSSYMPDLVVLDLGLPDSDGMEFLKQIRKEFLTPVIVLSARTDEKDKVLALDLGANDYVTKPFSCAEFVARVRSTLRNLKHSVIYENNPEGKFKSGKLEINYDSRCVFIDNKEIKFTQTEYNIISYLSKHCGKVKTYSSIIRAIWGFNDLYSVKKLQVNMANIRRKLGEKIGESNYIVNELGVGYRMREIDE